MAIFWQYWYLYPLIPFITLCLKATITALNHELQMVRIDVEIRERNCALRLPGELLQEKKAIRVELSVAAETKQRQNKKMRTWSRRTRTGSQRPRRKRR